MKTLDGIRNARVVVEMEEMYGPFPGGDPRMFTPDPDPGMNTPEEIARHKEACTAWDRGEGEDRGPGCIALGDASVVTRQGYGFGTWRGPMEVVYGTCEGCDGAGQNARGEPCHRCEGKGEERYI